MQEFALVGLFMLLALGAWWSLVTFPKQRDFQKRQRFVRSVVEGDEVITYGGVIGKVKDLSEGVAYVEIADGVVVRMLAASVVQPFDADEVARHARKALASEGPSEGATPSVE